MNENISTVLDLEQKIRDSFKKQRTSTGSRYMLVDVKRVEVSTRDSSLIRVKGDVIGSGESVALLLTKSASGQHNPEVGGVLRADRYEMSNKVTKEPGVQGYMAKYFLSYPPGDFCLQATCHPTTPRDREGNNNYSAKVLFADHEVNASTVNLGALMADPSGKVLLPFLKPWENTKPSSITHDVVGRSIWEKPVAAMSPAVVLRLLGQSYIVYGAASTKGPDNTAELPNNEAILNSLGRSRSLAHFTNAIRESGIPKDALNNVEVDVIPLLSVNVGRDILSGQKEKYLKSPGEFSVAVENDNGVATPRRGWKSGAMAQLKVSRSNSLCVVDLVPGSWDKAVEHIPLTAHEQKIENQRLARQVSQAPDQPANLPQNQNLTASNSPDQAKPQNQPVQQPVQQQAPREQQSESAPSQVSPSGPVTNDYDQSFFIDDSEMADDFAAMEAMNVGSNGFDTDLANVFDEAEERIRTRRAPSL